jgi:hypothetical protein
MAPLAPRPRRRLLHWALAAIAVIEIGVGCSLLEQRAARRAAPDAASPTLAPRPALDEVAPAAAPRPIARAASRRIHRPKPKPAAPGDGVEICGYGSVDLPPDDPYGLERLPPAKREAARAAADALMLASDDTEVRAAALMIGALSGRVDARARIDRLARLAGASQDPVVYVIALEACRSYAADEGNACRLLSRAEWARLDPDNALPWLELAAESPRDSEAEADAMNRAAQARRSDARAGLLPSLVERALRPAAPALPRTLALSASWSAQAAWAPPRSGQAYAYCTAEALEDANRRQTCEALAETLSTRSTVLGDLAVGISIGRNLGWPAERLRALQQENDVLSQAGRFPAIGLDLSCAGVERVQAWMRRLAESGEVQAARDALAESGASIEQWDERYRKELALATAAAEAAARAAAGVH